jgi:ABC-type Zn uptake system ZnuABC Zn-binding protein ZnuA
MKRILAAVPVVLGSALFVGCAGPSVGGATDAVGGDHRPSVVATTTQLADFTRSVAGDAFDVTQLIQPNQGAHGYEPSAADLLALADADVLVQNGVGLEEWLDSAGSASGFEGEIIVASEGIAISDLVAGDHDPALESEAEHAEHTHEAGDPHIWTDPANAIGMVETITTGLLAVDGVDTATVEAHSEAYTADLVALDEWIAASIGSVPAESRLLVTNHDTFGYFAERYGVDYVGSVIPGFDDNAEPSAAQIDALVARIDETGTTAVFAESSISPRTAQTIASEAGVTVYSGEDALYGDSLGPAGSAGETYISSQLHNVTLLLEAWDGTPAAVPAELQG